MSRAAGEADGVVVVEEVAGVEVFADPCARLEGDALGGHLVDAALHDVLFELEVGDSEPEQSSDVLVALVHGDAVAPAVELLRGGHAGGSRSDDGDGLAGADRGRLRGDPAVLPAVVGYGLFDVLDGDGVVGLGVAVVVVTGASDDAGGLAGGGTDAPGELWEVVGRVEGDEGLVPLVAVDEVVPVGNDVSEGATGEGVAHGDGAVHAPAGLLARLGVVPVEEELLPVLDALGDGPLGERHPCIVYEACGLSHEVGVFRGRPLCALFGPWRRAPRGLACSRAA